MRGLLFLTLITTACGGAAGCDAAAADRVALQGLAGHHVQLTCNPPSVACIDYGVSFSIANRGDAAIERIDALDLRVDGQSLLTGGPVACAEVPWTVAARAQSNPLQVSIDLEQQATARVPCGPRPLDDIIVVPIAGGQALGLSVVELDIGGHLADGTRFNVSNRVDVTST